MKPIWHISQKDTYKSMLKELIQKMKFGSCKTKTSDDVNAFEESGKKKPEDTEK